MNKLLAPIGVFLLLAFSTPFALAQDAAAASDAPAAAVEEPAAAAEPAATLESGDTAWMLTATLLVLLMTIPGLSLFYGGLVRSKNVLSVLMQCFFITAVMSILWVVCGYSLASSGDGLLFGDLKNLFLKNLTLDSLNGDRKSVV